MWISEEKAAAIIKLFWQEAELKEEVCTCEKCVLAMQNTIEAAL